jgi:hypothetical protein
MGRQNFASASAWCVAEIDFPSPSDRNRQKPNAGQDVILAGDLVAKDMKSVLERLGKNYTVFKGTFNVLLSGIGEVSQF